ncbi:MAG: hypothetical protein A2X05_06895 [Bacteroidetes bacterium GWE2_41_25]|nr:MAG: hypothetical protein A2X05_06895 [Bacteroidetes bacterium GWE2_41_25]HCU20385.1 hypothetical protein [Bacteroidales bacterium]
MKQLISLHRISVSFFITLISLTSPGADHYRLPAGAGEAGTGYSCIMKNGFWSSFHNQALLADNQSFTFGVNYQDRFGISELGTRTAGVIISSGKTSLGLIYSHFGYVDYRRNMTGLACGLKLSEKLAAGVQVDYFAEMVPGEYEDVHLVTGEAGIVFHATENTLIGVHLFNPVPGSLTKISMPATLRIGAGTNLNNLLFAGAETEMSSGNAIILRMGFEYEAAKKIWLRSGFSTENNSFSFGIGCLAKFIKIDLAFSTHERLGITSSASLIFKIH